MRTLPGRTTTHACRHALLAGVFSAALAGCSGGGGAGPAALPGLAPPAAATAPGLVTRAASTAWTTAAAQSADSLVETVGVNVHLSYYGSPYDPSTFSTLASLLERSGIRHLRDGMPYGQQAPVSEAKQLAWYGLRFDYIVGAHDTASQVSGWFSTIGMNVADACEGVNEPDAAGGTWAPNARSQQHALYGVCHPLGYPVIGPAMINGASYATFGNTGDAIDVSNMHDYFSWRNPGTPGWGGGGYGSLAYNERNANAEAPNAAYVSTETGYSSSPNDSSDLGEAYCARYLVRTILEAFRSGVARTYLYEFADEGGSPASADGLVDGSLAPKPAYGAIAGLQAMLGDRGAVFTPGSLQYAISGADASLHTLLLERHDGTYWLVLWKEAEEYQGDKKTPEPVGSESLTIAFPSAPASLASHVLRDDGTYASATLTSSASIALAVDGHPTLLQIVPSAAAQAASAALPHPLARPHAWWQRR